MVRDLAIKDETKSLENAVNQSTKRPQPSSSIPVPIKEENNISVLSTVELNGGTKVYMAPELKQTKHFTKACDVYSYGVILLELITLEDPSVSLDFFLER